jgi:hypothetical protein
MLAGRVAAIVSLTIAVIISLLVIVNVLMKRVNLNAKWNVTIQHNQQDIKKACHPHNQQDIKKACHPRMFLSGIHKVKIWIMNIKLRFPD